MSYIPEGQVGDSFGAFGFGSDSETVDNEIQNGGQALEGCVQRENHVGGKGIQSAIWIQPPEG